MSAGPHQGMQLQAQVRLDLHQVATEVVARLLGEDSPVPEQLSEASVHRPKRSTIWVASFTGPAGGQVWRSTGLTNREQALLVARNWEAEARRHRATLGRRARKPVWRVGRSERVSGLLTQKEVAQLLNVSERCVREIERRALAKLRRHPLLREIWQEYVRGELEEAYGCLTPAEVDALLGLCRSTEEYRLVKKVLQVTQT